MSKASYDMPNIGTVFITKKRGQRTMRLRIDTKGAVQVSMPWILPRSAAFDFIRSKADWIKEQQTATLFEPYNGMLFGKAQRLIIRQNSTSSRAVQDGRNLIVNFTGLFDPENSEHNARIEKALVRSLRTETERVLLPRLKEFATEYGFQFNSSGVKQVTGRWGSCDSKGHITLSLFLIQLPIELIDYVLIHELAHTVEMNHSSEFWKVVARYCPDYRQLKKRMRGLQPRLYDAKTFMA